jgi:hypothetical protein
MMFDQWRVIVKMEEVPVMMNVVWMWSVEVEVGGGP